MNSIYESKLLIIDDEIELLRMEEQFLRKEGFTKIHTAKNCREAEEVFERVRPDCIILDVMLPDGNGFDLMKRFRKSADVPILFLSARDEDEDRLLGLGLGADDYIVKPFLPRELILRLCAILKRTYSNSLLDQPTKSKIELGSCSIDFNTGEVLGLKKNTTLTAKEYAILTKLYENRGKIVTGDSLCYAVWGDGLYGYENTLMVHIRRLREKIEENPSQPRYIKTIRGLGYKLEKE